MAFDGIVTTAMVTELSNKLSGAKIDKIYQPAKDEIIINIRSGRDKLHLCLSAGTNNAGIYLVQEKGSNPQNPPAFCMLLRKHLQSARIRKIFQVSSERIVEIHTDTVNELGFDVKHKLTIEIMGKHSNILLIDLKKNKILDCIKRISGDVNRYRQTLPGLDYIPPPSHDKISYFDLDKETFLKHIGDVSDRPDKALINTIQGISPTVAEEICFRASLKCAQADIKYADVLYYELMNAINETMKNKGAFIYCSKDQTPREFHVLDLSIYHEDHDIKHFDSVSDACSAYFEGRTASNRVRQKAGDIRHHVSNSLNKMLLKKQRLSEDIIKAEDAEKYRLYGELLTASLHKIKNGMTEAKVENYYDGNYISIPLDPKYSAAQNAQQYFKKYSKSRTAIIEKNKQLTETNAEIDYLDSILTFIDNSCTTEDIEDIRTELIENGILKRRHNTKERSNKAKISPHEYFTENGKRILVGRNNRENDILTFKTASSQDIWFHTKNIPGSHVILFTSGEEVSDDDLFEAAALAAAHSKAKLSGNVPVDYVKVKYVKKPNGSKPGYVIFTHNKTIYTDPAKI